MFFPKGKILSSTANRVAVATCSLVRKEVFGTTAHLANYQKGPTDSLLDWQWGWNGWDLHSHTDLSQNPGNLQSQKFKSDTGSILPKVFCARNARATQN